MYTHPIAKKPQQTSWECHCQTNIWVRTLQAQLVLPHTKYQPEQQWAFENKESISQSWLPCDVIPPLKTTPKTLSKGGVMVGRVNLCPWECSYIATVKTLQRSIAGLAGIHPRRHTQALSILCFRSLPTAFVAKQGTCQ